MVIESRVVDSFRQRLMVGLVLPVVLGMVALETEICPAGVAAIGATNSSLVE
ncbi:MAG: hypothetical protein WCA14_15805 [Steroidobacteraceae bacterium]